MTDTPLQRFPRLERRQILIIGIAVILIASGWAILRASRSDPTAAPPPASIATSAAPRPQPDDLVEATRALGTTQQQAIDQLQVVQDLLTAQRAETKRLSEDIEALNRKVGALQEAVTGMAAAQRAAPAKNGR